MIRTKFDGYTVGDRLLEGVMFLVEVDEQLLKVVSVAPLNNSYDDYLNDLNKAKWLKEVEDYVNSELNNSFDATTRQGPNYLDEFKEFIEDFGLQPI